MALLPTPTSQEFARAVAPQIVPLVLVLAACGPAEEEPQVTDEPVEELEAEEAKADSAGKSRWTVLVYSSSDNNLDAYTGQVLLDELAAFGSNERITYLVQMDRAPGWGDAPILNQSFAPETKRFRVEKGSLTELANLGEVNMGQAAALGDFIKWGLKTAPADKVALILWDHGGAQSGFGWDDTDNDHLSVPEIAAGMKAGLGAKKIQFTMMYACLMGQLEVAYEIQRNTRWMVASEEISYAGVFPIAELAQALEKNPRSETLMKALPGMVTERVKANGLEGMVTFSVLDTNKVEAARTAVEKLGAAISRAPLKTQALDVAAAIRASETFGLVAGGTNAYTTDANDLFERLAKIPALATQARATQAAVKAVVVSNRTDASHPNAAGVAIYANLDTTFDADYAALKFAKTSSWFAGVKAVRKALAPDHAPPQLAALSVEEPFGNWVLRSKLTDPAARLSVYRTTMDVAYYASNGDVVSIGEWYQDMASDGSMSGTWAAGGIVVSDGRRSGPIDLRYMDTWDKGTVDVDRYWAMAQYTAPSGEIRDVAFIIDATRSGDVSVVGTWDYTTNGVAEFLLEEGALVVFKSNVNGADVTPSDPTRILKIGSNGLTFDYGELPPGRYRVGFSAWDLANNQARLTQDIVVR